MSAYDLETAIKKHLEEKCDRVERWRWRNPAIEPLDLERALEDAIDTIQQAGEAWIKEERRRIQAEAADEMVKP